MTEFNYIRKLLNQIFKDHNLYSKIYFVGGCVRDVIRKYDPKDIDLVVEDPFGAHKTALIIHKELKNKVTEPFKKGAYPIWSITIKDNIEYKGRFYPIKDITIEIADTMKESYPNPNSRQRETEFASIEEDLKRRDFSINSGLMNLDGEIVYINNFNKSFIQDIEKGIIKCNDNINKDQIFIDDPLRMMRAATFAARFNYIIDEETKQAIIRNKERIKIISQERIVKEIEKVVNIPQGLYNLVLQLDNLQLLEYIFPDIAHQKTIKQQPDIRMIHLEGNTVFDHTLSVLRNSKIGLINSIAALYHDVGKNEKTREEINGKIRFIGHEKVGGFLANRILHDMKFSHDDVKKIVFLIQNHMIIHQMTNHNKFTDKAIRKFIRDCGDIETINMLFDLVNADSLGTIQKMKDGTLGVIANHDLEYKRIIDLMNQDAKLNVKNNHIFNGNEIMNMLNIKGKDVGIAIEIMLDIQDEFGLDINREFAKQELIERFNKRKKENVGK